MKIISNNLRLMRDKEVAASLAISRSYVWTLVKKGVLPQPCKIGEKISVWRAMDIQKYIDAPILLSGGEK